jgi:3-oxoacyl-[acyl-carrier protein] reductase
MDLHLKDKVALVTGGSQGLGKAICLGLAAEGSKVAVNYLKDVEKGLDFTDQAQRVVAEIEDKFTTKAIAVAADISSPEQIKRMFGEVAQSLGPLDVLINNAGIWPTAYVKDITVEQWETTLDINLKGPFVLCRDAVRGWLSAGRGGRIVNITSQAAFQGSTTGHAHYAASKAGLVAFTKSLAREVAPAQIYVNAVAPGIMNTEMLSGVTEEDKQNYIGRIPIRRISEPCEVADVAVFLASDRASSVTGTTFDATGGMLMR